MELMSVLGQVTLQSDGRPTAFTFGIERRDDGQQPGPRNEGFHAREKSLVAGNFLFIGKFGLGKTRLMDHAYEFRRHRLTRLN